MGDDRERVFANSKIFRKNGEKKLPEKVAYLCNLGLGLGGRPRQDYTCLTSSGELPAAACCEGLCRAKEGRTPGEGCRRSGG